MRGTHLHAQLQTIYCPPRAHRSLTHRALVAGRLGGVAGAGDSGRAFCTH